MTTTKAIASALTSTAAAAAALSVPAVMADAMTGTAFWQPVPDHLTVCSEYGCRDCDALAEAAVAEAEAEVELAEVERLLAMTEAELAALDAYLDGDTEVEVERFPDGLGWDWPGTDWDQPTPF